jgi:telomere length regulation protein
VRITGVLLGISNDYALDDFNLVRHRTIVAVGVVCPALVGGFLADQFYARNYTLGQRLEMLEAISGIVKELSAAAVPSTEDIARDGAKISVAHLPEQLDDPDAARRQAAQAIVQRRIDAKTRRFASPRRPPVQGVVNGFSGFVGAFFWPLLREYDRSTPTMDLRGKDTLVLGRLIHTVAVVLHCAGAASVVPAMASTLMEVALSLRMHKDVAVRRAVGFCFVVILRALHPEVLLATMAVEVREAQLHMQHIYEEDADAECRALAAAGLIAASEIGRTVRG